MKSNDIVSTRIEIKRESLPSNVALRVYNLLSLNLGLEVKVSQLGENKEIRKKKNETEWSGFDSK